MLDSLIALISGHRHYWGVPYERASDGKVVMTCYACSRTREVVANLHPEFERGDV